MDETRFRLTGKTALVVGGRGFLGRRLANALHSMGADVHAADLPTLSKAAQGDSTRPDDQELTHHDIDVTDQTSVREVVQSVAKQSRKGIDVLVYAATTKPDDFYKPFTECSLDGWRHVLEVELNGMFLCTREVGKLMEKQEAGSMILMSSIYGIVGNDQRIYKNSGLSEVYGEQEDEQDQIYSHAAYSAAKGGVISMTKFLAAYWGKHNIRVNCVSPGGVAHPEESHTFVEKYSERVPLRRKAEPAEISGAVCYLASDAASYVTGENIVVDGGFTKW